MSNPINDTYVEDTTEQLYAHCEQIIDYIRVGNAAGALIDYDKSPELEALVNACELFLSIRGES